MLEHAREPPVEPVPTGGTARQYTGRLYSSTPVVSTIVHRSSLVQQTSRLCSSRPVVSPADWTAGEMTGPLVYRRPVY